MCIMIRYRLLCFDKPNTSFYVFERAVMNYRPMLDGERFMTDKELCARLQLSRRTLQDYRNNGVIPYIQLGGKILYRESDIQKILMANYREAYRMKGL